MKLVFMVVIAIFFAGIIGFGFFSYALPNKYEETVNISKTTPISSSSISSHSLKPVISNQWYSSLFFNFPSQPIFALPLAFQFTPNGISFSYPEINKTRNTIFASFVNDFTIGFEDSFLKPKIDQVGDWHITGSLKNNKNETLAFTIGHGMPFAILHTQAAGVLLTSPMNIVLQDSGKLANITSKSFYTDSLIVTIQKHMYILIFPQKTQISVTQKQLKLINPHRIFIGLLDSKNHIDTFKQAANVEIYDTSAQSIISGNTVETTYSVITNTIIPLLALYPHQSDFLSTRQNIIGSYPTIRGNLQLIHANAFTTKFPLITPDTSFSKLPDNTGSEVKQIRTDILSFITQPVPTSQDYYLGTWFGKGSSLLQLADTYGLNLDKQKLLDFMEPQFIKSLDYFSYNKQKTSLIAKKPEFGNENLNDHHFHYGYYIRTAAVLTQIDSGFLQKIKPQVQLMVNDIATIDRNSDTFPYLRHFDMYEGHSWADGYGNFTDGTNQESTSEAINAWYGVYLWGKVTNSPTLSSSALALYNAEILSSKYYWFDIHHIYTQPYVHAIASIVWGGKVDFTTWFSPNTNMIYGIQLIPFTPASMYLGSLGDFSPYLKDYSDHGGNIQNTWGDTFLMWKALYIPTVPVSEVNQIKSPEPDIPYSLFLYFLSLPAQTTK